MRKSDLLHTASFRLALIYAALFSLSATVLIIFVYYTTTTYMQRQFDGFVDSQRKSLVLLDRGGGAEALARILEARLRPRLDPFAYYLVLNRDGHKLAGNLDAAMARVGWATQDLDDQADRQSLVVRTTGVTLPTGGLLVVGRSESRLLTVQGLIRSSLHIDLFATMIMAALGGIALSSLALRRIGTIEAALNRIMHGNLSTRLTVTGRDEVARLTLRVNQLLDWFQTSSTSLQQITNDVAHDLRRPLGALRQSLDEALHLSPTPEHYEKSLTNAIVRVDAILALFSALLRLAQIEAGVRRGKFRSVDLADLISELFEVYEPVARAGGRSLILLPLHRARVHGDRELLTQLVANLIENAIRHTACGTQIYVGTGVDPATLLVADTGAGIPPEERDKVFRRFYRVERGLEVSGNGLGLSVVSTIAALHGASISLTDTAGLSGSTGLQVEITFSTLCLM